MRADTPTCRDLAVCFYVTVWCFCLFEASVVYILLQQERRGFEGFWFGFFLSLKTNLKILQKPAEVKISFNVLFENNFCSKSRIHLPFTLQEKGTKLQAIRPLWEHHSRCRKKKSIFFSLVSVHRSARKRNKKASCEMEIIPATDIPWSTRELSRWLPLAAHFQLLGAPYSWDYAGKAA